MKNRIGSGAFNLMMTAWQFNGQTLTQQWKWLRGNQTAPDGHNTRVIDVNGDGTDEVAEIGFVLNAPAAASTSCHMSIYKPDPRVSGLVAVGTPKTAVPLRPAPLVAGFSADPHEDHRRSRVDRDQQGQKPLRLYRRRRRVEP